MSDFVLSQVLISIAIIFDVASFQCKQRHYIVGCLSVAGMLISVHFMLLSQWTGALLMITATIRYFVSIFTTHFLVKLLFVMLNITISALTYVGLVNLISLLGATFQTVAAFQDQDKTLRQLMIIGTFFWLAHNAIVGSPAAVIMELLFLLSNITAYYRFYLKVNSNSMRH